MNLHMRYWYLSHMRKIKFSNVLAIANISSNNLEAKLRSHMASILLLIILKKYLFSKN